MAKTISALGLIAALAVFCGATQIGGVDVVVTDSAKKPLEGVSVKVRYLAQTLAGGFNYGQPALIEEMIRTTSADGTARFPSVFPKSVEHGSGTFVRTVVVDDPRYIPVKSIACFQMSPAERAEKSAKGEGCRFRGDLFTQEKVAYVQLERMRGVDEIDELLLLAAKEKSHFNWVYASLYSLLPVASEDVQRNAVARLSAYFESGMDSVTQDQMVRLFGKLCRSSDAAVPALIRYAQSMKGNMSRFTVLETLRLIGTSESEEYLRSVLAEVKAGQPDLRLSESQRANVDDQIKLIASPIDKQRCKSLPRQDAGE